MEHRGRIYCYGSYQKIKLDGHVGLCEKLLELTIKFASFNLISVCKVYLS